jgi:DNA polymerase-3 subunit epsilon
VVTLTHRNPPDREESRRWAQGLLERSGWAILDTETTGLDATAEVIQIAVLDPDGTCLMDTLVRPLGRIPSDAVAIHGINDKKVAAAPPYSEIHSRLIETLQGRRLIAYNAQFDRRLLRQTANQNGLWEIPNQWDCAMEQYARFVGQWNSRRGSYAWQPLPRPDSPPGHKHQAIDDCLATLAVIRRMVQE